MSIQNVDLPSCACSAEDIQKDVELVTCPMEKTSDLKFSPNAVCHKGKCLSCEEKLKICFDGGSFEPVPYDINLPEGSEYAPMQDPPLDIALDHAIGVIWYIFGVDKKKILLDIPQLEIALQYLKTLQGTTCPNDVMLCIEIIENRLIDLYSMADDKKLGITFNETICYPIKETAPETPSVNLMEVAKRSPEMWENYIRNIEIPRIVLNEAEDYGQSNSTHNSTIQQQKTFDQQHDSEICACCQEKVSYVRILQDWQKDQRNRVHENIHSLDILGNVISQWSEEVCKAGNNK